MASLLALSTCTYLLLHIYESPSAVGSASIRPCVIDLTWLALTGGLSEKKKKTFRRNRMDKKQQLEAMLAS